jgi:hypothetical protein
MINISIQITDAAQVAAIMEVLSGRGTSPVTTQEVVTERKSRARKEDAPAPAPEVVEAKPEPAVEPKAEEKKESPADHRKRLQARLVQFVSQDPGNKKKFDAANAKFGVSGFSKLPDDKLADFEKELFG